MSLLVQQTALAAAGHDSEFSAGVTVLLGCHNKSYNNNCPRKIPMLPMQEQSGQASAITGQLVTHHRGDRTVNAVYTRPTSVQEGPVECQTGRCAVCILWLQNHLPCRCRTCWFLDSCITYSTVCEQGPEGCSHGSPADAPTARLPTAPSTA